jgi:hypothetical protein
MTYFLSILVIVLSAIVIVSVLLWATGTPYEQYFAGAQFVHFLLGTATVALALPLFTHFRRVKAMAGPLLTALLLGSLAAMGSAPTASDRAIAMGANFLSMGQASLAGWDFDFLPRLAASGGASTPSACAARASILRHALSVVAAVCGVIPTSRAASLAVMPRSSISSAVRRLLDPGRCRIIRDRAVN